MNQFKNVIKSLEFAIEDLKQELDSGNLTAQQEMVFLNGIKEYEYAILTLESSIELLNLGSINAINTLQR